MIQNSGEYLILFYTELRPYPSPSSNGEIRVLINGEEIARTGKRGFSGSDYYPLMGFKVIYLDSGINNLKIDFRRIYGNYPINIRNIRVTVRKISNFFYEEDEFETESSSSSYTTKLKYEFNIGISDTYIVLSYGELQAGNGSFRIARFVRTLVNNYDPGSEMIKYHITRYSYVPYFFVKDFYLSEGLNSIEIQYRVDPSGSVKLRRARILLIKKRDFLYLYSSTDETETRTLSTSFETKVSLNVYLTEQKDFVLVTHSYLGSKRISSWNISHRVEARILVDGQEISRIRVRPYYNYASSIFEYFPYSFPITLSLSSGAHVIEIQWRTLHSSYYAYIKNARIYLLEINKIGAVSYGELVSSYFDTGEYGETRYEKIFFDSFVPSGSGIKFQLAGSNDGVNFKWFGPDGTDTTYYTFSGQDISDSLYGKRYIRYKVILESQGISPELYELKILCFKDYYINEPEGSDLNPGKRNFPFLTLFLPYQKLFL